jgi:hypothetical protein
MTNPCGLTFALALFVVFVFHFAIEACFFIFTLGVLARRKRVRKREYYDEKRLIFSPPRPYQSARQIFYVTQALFSFACSRHKDNADGTYSLNADYTYNFKQNICARLIRPLCCRQTKLCV